MLKLNKILSLLIFFLALFPGYGCEISITFLEQKQLNKIVKRNVHCASLSWIMPEDITTTVPHTYEWVREGCAGYETSHEHRSPGLATTGLLTCTGITAFTSEGLLGMAHITDMAPSSSALNFLRTINVDTSKPITLVSKTLNDSHLLKVKSIIEDASDEEVIIHIKTMPIFTFKNKTYTSLTKDRYNLVMEDHRGISLSFTSEGYHTFFSMNLENQKRISKTLAQYNPEEWSYDELYIHRLPYKTK